MKRTILTTLLLLTLSLSAYGASALYPYPANWSFGDLADWAMPKIALATDTLPPIASAAVGDIVILTNPASNTMGAYQWQLWMAAPPDGNNLATWSWSMIYQPSAGASMTEHINATGTSVHGLGTMATEAKTDYVATDTFTAHTGNTSNPHAVTYSQIGAEPVGAIRKIDPRDNDGYAVVRENGAGLSSSTAEAFRAALEVFSKAETSSLVPNNASFTLAGLGAKPFSALTDKPTTLNGYGITDAASSDALTAHVASTGTSVHGLGTMSLASTTDYVATDTFIAHTGNTSNPHAVTYSQIGAEPAGAIRKIDPRDNDGYAVVRENGAGLSSSTAEAFRAALEVFSKAETSSLIPNNASFTLAGLGAKPFSALTDKPTTLNGYGITDAALDASLTAHVEDMSNPHSVTYSQLSDAPTFGSMASETATNYVATSTLTAHESDTSTHGKTTIAGMEDIDDLSGVTDAATARTTLGVAASSATVLTSGANAMTESLKFSGNYGIMQSTSDGADTGFTFMCGGAFTSGSLRDRGAAFVACGNEYPTYGGQAWYFAGNLPTGDHVWYTGAGTTRMTLKYSGNLLIGATIDDGTNKLQVNGGVSCVASLQQPSGGSVATGILKTSYATLAKDAEYTFSLISGAYPGTMMLYEGNNGCCAKFYFDRMAAATVEEHDLQNKYSTSKDTSGTINIYYSGSELKMQNKTAANVVIRFTILALIP